MLMMTAWMMLASTAEASDRFTVTAELGAMGTRDDNWSMFTYNDQLPSAGGRVAVNVRPRLDVVADYQAGRYGEWLTSETIYYDTEYDYEYSNAGLDVTVHQIGLGPKFTLRNAGVFRPYGTTQAQAVVGRLRLMEDIDEPDTAMRFSDTSLGGVAALGVDVLPLQRLPIQLITHLEAGYAQSFALNFEDGDAGSNAVPIGDLALGGFYLRWGVGLQF